MRRRFPLSAALAVTLPIVWAHSEPAVALDAASMPTPYVNETDMASINEAFSVDACAPWGFGHGGIDFFPTGDLEAFRAVADGTIESIDKLYNAPVDKWQVDVNLRIDATYLAGYAFEPMSDQESDANIQLTHLVVTEGQAVSQGDLLGYLLTIGPGAHVHFSLYEVWDPVCPDPYFTQAAGDSILTVLGWTGPTPESVTGSSRPSRSPPSPSTATLPIGPASPRWPAIGSRTTDFLESRETLEPVDREELIRRVRDGEALVLDVRPREEYETAHIAGALSAPLSELKNFLAELPRDKQIVAYCRGPYCVMSIDTVRLLRAAGFEAVRLEDGVPDWRARGLEVEPAGVQP